MKQVSMEELSKISAFISSCNDMINGKFILADIKINKILKMIASSDELYRYTTSCLVDFDFAKELHRAEVKNRFNGGEFVLPEEDSKIVAMVFNLLVSFNTKQIDFYVFIRENFSSITSGNEYNNFSKAVLVPFRNIIAKEFGLSTDEKQNNEQFEQPKQEEENLEQQNEIPLEEPQEQKPEEPTKWTELVSNVNSLLDAILTDRKIKPDLKDGLVYLLKTVKHSIEYEDIQVISALLSAFDLLTKKYRSVKFIFPEVERCVLDIYDEQKQVKE